MKNRLLLTLLALTSLCTLGACSEAKKQLGLEKSSPDEFAVVKRAPLAMPPDFALRPPTPGAPRPQEQATSEQAREAVLGTDTGNDAGPAKAEEALLENANAGSQPNIRNIVDGEAAKTDNKNEPVAKRLLHIGSKSKPDAKVVDPTAEAQRLKKNADEGKPVTDGETPSVDD